MRGFGRLLEGPCVVVQVSVWGFAGEENLHLELLVVVVLLADVAMLEWLK